MDVAQASVHEAALQELHQAIGTAQRPADSAEQRAASLKDRMAAAGGSLVGASPTAAAFAPGPAAPTASPRGLTDTRLISKPSDCSGPSQWTS